MPPRDRRYNLKLDDSLETKSAQRGPQDVIYDFRIAF